MENEIVKLFEEYDLMTWNDYNQMRVMRVRQLIEKYQRITQEVVLKLHEKTLVVKTNELNNIKEELARNQVTDQKTLLKRDLNLNSEPKSDLHTERKPFSCKHCKHGFRAKNRLEKHEIVCEPKQTRKILQTLQALFCNKGQIEKT